MLASSHYRNVSKQTTRLVPSCFVIFDLEPLSLSLDFIQRISLTGFPSQSVGSSNTDVLDLPCLLVLITETSQSRQHVDTSLIHIESRKSPTAVLFDDDTGRISIRHSCGLNDVQQVHISYGVAKSDELRHSSTNARILPNFTIAMVESMGMSYVIVSSNVIFFLQLWRSRNGSTTP
ncbi:hypothetical protein Tco_0451844 [Tanacetum coccineum]